MQTVGSNADYMSVDGFTSRKQSVIFKAFTFRLYLSVMLTFYTKLFIFIFFAPLVKSLHTYLWLPGDFLHRVDGSLAAVLARPFILHQHQDKLSY